MSPRAAEDEGTSAPAATYELIGHDAALAQAARAIRQGTLPQAWLICGPPGVGKATFAFRIARYLLRFGALDAGPADLAVAPTDPVSRQIEAGAHPGLIVLKREINEKTGKLKTIVDVDTIRRLGGFFGLTSGAGGWRITIVDSADDMNDNAANALLKVLEEPPRRSLLLLVSHAPGRLLPTIRSRCQRLSLRSLAHADVEAALARLQPELDAETRQGLAALSGGSLGLALRLVEEDGLALAHEADSLIGAARPDIPAILLLAERLQRQSDGLAHFGAFLSRALAARIRARAAGGGGDLERWSAIRERIDALYARADGLNMEPRQTVLTSVLAASKA